MISIKDLKHISSLKQGKFRKEHAAFFAEGPKVVQELLDSDYELNGLYALPSFFENNPQWKNHALAHHISSKELGRMSALKQANEVLAVFKIPSIKLSTKIFESEKMILFLENMNDPGNLGTIIRIADWYGIKHIVCTPTSVDMYNPKVVQSTMGSISRVQCYYTESAAFFHMKPDDYLVYASIMEGENIYQQELNQKSILMIGSESHGLSKEVLSNANICISIPPFDAGSHAESLNASVATGIIINEFIRT